MARILLVIAVIVVLTLTACAPALTAVPTGTFIPSAVVPTSTSTAITVTATATLTVAQEPPPCTFPLAQITTTESAPENYTFSEPKVVLTSKDNRYGIAQWLPDNQQVLMTEVLFSTREKGNNNPPPESIELYNPETGDTKVVATRSVTHELPSWSPQLNAVIYSVDNFLGLAQNTGVAKFTRQVWISYGDPATAQKLADNLPQLSFAMKPDGSKTIYLVDKQIDELDDSLNELPSVPFDPTQWDYAQKRRVSGPISFEMEWQLGTSLIFLYSAGDGEGGYTFILNADTGKVCELNLGGWAIKARWSLDGRYLAIIRTHDQFPINLSDLAVLDSVTGKVYSINVTSSGEGKHYVDDFVWALDGYHLLAIGRLMPNTNQSDDQQSRLYLVDFISEQNDDVLPTYTFYADENSSNLAWSPDSSKLVVRCPTQTIDKICFISVQKAGQ